MLFNIIYFRTQGILRLYRYGSYFLVKSSLGAFFVHWTSFLIIFKIWLKIVFGFVKINLVILMEYKVTTYDEEETIQLAENIESEKFSNMVICLDGDLGSGKTVFAKGFASALGINEVITSPTFTVVKEYFGGEMPLFHMDVYRLDEANVDINFDEYFLRGGVCIVEWSSMIQDKLPSERLEIEFRITSEDTRVLVVRPYGKKYEDLCEAVL